MSTLVGDGVYFITETYNYRHHDDDAFNVQLFYLMYAIPTAVLLTCATVGKSTRRRGWRASQRRPANSTSASGGEVHGKEPRKN